MSTAVRPVAGATAPTGRYVRLSDPPRHPNADRVPDALASLRVACIAAWHDAPARLSHAESQPIRDLTRTPVKWPSIHRLVAALCALRDPAAWDRVAQWAAECRAALFPRTTLTIDEAWDSETHAEAISDVAVRKAARATDAATIEGAQEAVRSQIAKGLAVLDALERRRQDIVRPMSHLPRA